MMHGHPPQPPHPHMAHLPPPPPPTTVTVAATGAPPPGPPGGLPPHNLLHTSLPPPAVPPMAPIPQHQHQHQQPHRDHGGPRINNRHHHHPRVQQGGGGSGPDHHHHSPMPIPPHMSLQQQNSRKPPAQHYGGNNGMVSGGGGAPMMSSKHHQHHHHQTSGGGGGGHHNTSKSASLSYSNNQSQQHSSHHSSNHHHHGHQQHHHHNSAGVPVVSAAGPGGAKTRMIPSHDPKMTHNHNTATPTNNTSNAIVVHQTDPVQQLSGGSASSTVSTTAPGTVTGSANSSSSLSNTSGSSGTGIPTSGSGGGGGPPLATISTGGAPPDSSGLKESNSQMQQQTCSQLLSSVPDTLANTKEKTPMCLVNELARYNKIQHQYRLTGESGPAHKKRFTVTLKLGDEEYTAEGPSIKKAQHSAAHNAIGATKYKHPPAKTNRTKTGGKTSASHITPTVELNALAMKRGEPTVYETEQVIPAVPTKFHGNNQSPGPSGAPPQPVPGANFFSAPPPGPHYSGGYHRGNGMYNPSAPGIRYGVPPPNSYNRRNPIGGKPDFHSRNHYWNHPVAPVDKIPVIPEVYKVTLHVGERTFLGEGPTLQAARHDAAARALEVLKPLTPDNNASERLDVSINSDDPDSDLKSPISLVHEMALKRKLTVQFEVHGEKGPPHMKVFTTLCKVGSIVTEGEGNGKKLSKKRAAEKMLDELKKLPPASPEKNTRALLKQKRKAPLPKKKTRNLIKENSDSDPLDMVNPISRLMQIQQARKEKEPEYTLVEERGVARRREFIMEVLASGKSANGIGPTKKIAKKEAAENLLVLLGYARSTPSVGSSNKENVSGSANEVPEKPPHRRGGGFREDRHNQQGGGSAGRQIAPGVLQINSGASNKPGHTSNKDQVDSPIEVSSVPPSSTPAKAPLANSTAGNVNTSPTANAPASTTTTATSSSNPDVGRMKEQLMYLAQLLKFEVMFSDFPKGNHGQYLTLVTLSTEPPQLCHGSGASLEESQDEASRGALEILSKIGLDNVKPKGTTTTTTTSTAAAASPADESKSPKPALSNGLKK
ncbi:double-stranded RNA-binding protein Staufen homolog 2-like [Uranotaenia lowii]|uniref:double-stranded RNA-binding protein Staufen homolog 2-like n=1 Tax=Uranotaenia lowii TaxID=190385 RepID=UPI00247ACBEF|nr:double-stranded RNA-binding protein Staufen homolog 2-like [Uranotaenia lowii]